jgi:hypothetical protein
VKSDEIVIVYLIAAAFLIGYLLRGVIAQIEIGIILRSLEYTPKNPIIIEHEPKR